MPTVSDDLKLARFILPEEIFLYFDLIRIQEEARELHFYLEEQNEIPESYLSDDLESKGFHSESVIKDFPLRNKALFLHIRRRRWLNQASGEVVSRDWQWVAGGTHYTQGFATFLKGLTGYLPDKFTVG
jgi:hypothetical protein